MEISSTNGGERGSAEASAYFLRQGGTLKRMLLHPLGAQVTLRLSQEPWRPPLTIPFITNFHTIVQMDRLPGTLERLGVPDLEKTIISSTPPHP